MSVLAGGLHYYYYDDDHIMGTLFLIPLLVARNLKLGRGCVLMSLPVLYLPQSNLMPQLT